MPEERFDPQSVLIGWEDAQGFTIAEAQTGVAVFEATGSGKSTGPGQLMARAYLREGMGGLVLCAEGSLRAYSIVRRAPPIRF